MVGRGPTFYLHIFLNCLFAFTDINGIESWKIVVRLSDKIVDPALRISVQTIDSLSSCAFRCHIKPICGLFQYNANKLCETYRNSNDYYREVGSRTGNRFFQLMPRECVAGLDEWLSDIQKCIWTPKNSFTADAAKLHCSTRSKLMTSVESQEKYDSFTKLMGLIGMSRIHVYSSHDGTSAFKWSAGQLVSGDNWCPEEPSGDGTCLEIDISGNVDTCLLGGFNDIPCNASRGYFCE